MDIFKIILVLIIAPFVLGFCYFVGSFFVDIVFKDKNDANDVENKWSKRIIRTIIGLIIVMLLATAMEKAGCSSNENKYYKM